VKKIIPYFLICVMLLSACKKDNTQTLKDKIVGKWSYLSLKGNYYNDNGTLNSSTDIATPFQSTDYFQFNSDGTYSNNLGQSHTNGTYSIASETSFTINIPGAGDENCRIVNIDGSTFNFVDEIPKMQGQSYLEFAYGLKK
jgi:hypothetical protein